MNSKVLIAVVAIVAALAIVFFKSGKSDVETTTTGSSRGQAAAVETATAATATAPPVKKTREVDENEALIAEYGDARTTLSKHVTTNVVALLDDIVAMGEMAASGEMGNAFGGRRASLRGAMGPVLDQLNLDESQREKAQELHRQFQQRELARTKQNINKVRSNPVPLMKLILASDAAAEGKITTEEFKQVQADSAGELSDILNPLDQKNFGRSKPLADEKFTEELRNILTDEQVATLEASLEPADSAATAPPANMLANIEPMSLDKMDKAVSSGKDITSGLKKMMEGMGALQELGPLPGVP